MKGVRFRLEIEGMTCEHCARNVAEALKALPGLRDVKVDYRAGVAMVTADNESVMEFSQIQQAISQKGAYRLVRIVKESGSGSTLKWALAAVGAALIGSSCCILPLLAAVGIFSGTVAAQVHWLDSLRPFFLGITIVALGIAWWSALRSKEVRKEGPVCDCEVNDRSSVRYGVVSAMRNVRVLAVITVIALALGTFPYWSGWVFGGESPQVNSTVSEVVVSAVFHVDGMTCGGCEQAVKTSVGSLPGVRTVEADHESGMVKVVWVPEVVSVKEIINAIEKPGYRVQGWEWVSK